ncbi:MAG TPA: ferritin-like domain-containing protein [Polyangiaceae bacterium]|nr:ferritin-like domain-containing protein [Polyangiaceae bacterium]
MNRRSRTDGYATLILSALGLTPFAACGGATTSTPGNSSASGAGGNDISTVGGSGGDLGSTTTVGGSGGDFGSTTTTVGGTGGSLIGAGGSGQGGSTTIEPRFPCIDPKPIGMSGFVACQGGLVHRAFKAACAYTPRPDIVNPNATDAGFPGQCRADADCSAKPYGRCQLSQGGFFCAYGCGTDTDCAAGSVCLCQATSGVCVKATCTVDADCGGQLCTTHDSAPGCGTTVLSCQTPTDACRSHEDCGSPTLYCVATAAGRRCVPASCVEGRPFLIANEARVAEKGHVAGWAALAFSTPDADARIPSPHLAEAWTKVALMEHASIAAFARFTLQLMSLGAPVELVEQSNQAMADETLHARLSFGLASKFAGREIGPGRLDIQGALAESSFDDILVGTIREGCIGETVASMRAAEALEHAQDTDVREALTRIARDEARHAELAWKFVRWALERGGESARRVAEREFAAASTLVHSKTTELSASDRALLAGGIIPEALGAVLHDEVIDRVILVCARALLGADVAREVRSNAKSSASQPERAA